MKQYWLNNNELTLKVKKAPLFIRGVMFIFSFLFFTLPSLGMIASVLSGNKLHIGFFIGIGVFGLLGFYLLRISLWNTYGSEKIIFTKLNTTYEVDYKWFKDGKKVKEIIPLTFSIIPVGYEEDNTGVLKIGNNDSSINCVTKLPIIEIEKLIIELKKIPL